MREIDKDREIERERERQSTGRRERERGGGVREMRGVRRKAVLFYTARACC